MIPSGTSGLLFRPERFTKSKNRPGDFAPGRFFFANAQAKLGWTAAAGGGCRSQRDFVNLKCFDNRPRPNNS